MDQTKPKIFTGLKLIDVCAGLSLSGFIYVK
ncbi:uncharacterized protein G2W53_037618 [Senna tora]|uniref:Uncharacterized protein n=1 Tax=Senna tora TaxID=362788 RepID=A0A834SQM7_9FABA|nr:uncharacterized protein G2W53_037618 [Senna tora]